MQRYSAGQILVPTTPTSTNHATSKDYVDTGLSGKQATISDLSTIRSGAAAGATAVQPADLATVATSGSYNDLLNKPTIPTVTLTTTSGSEAITVGADTLNFGANAFNSTTIPTNTNQLTNGAGFLTSSDLLNIIYPVGSLRTSKNAGETSFMGGTWSLIASNVTIPLGSEFGVQGNGKTLGLTDGTNNVGMATGNNIGQLYFGTGVYNVNVNTSTSWSGTNTKGQYGVVQDTATSGIKGVANSTLTGLYIYQRT